MFPAGRLYIIAAVDRTNYRSSLTFEEYLKEKPFDFPKVYAYMNPYITAYKNRATGNRVVLKVYACMQKSRRSKVTVCPWLTKSHLRSLVVLFVTILFLQELRILMRKSGKGGGKMELP